MNFNWDALGRIGQDYRQRRQQTDDFNLQLMVQELAQQKAEKQRLKQRTEMIDEEDRIRGLQQQAAQRDAMNQWLAATGQFGEISNEYMTPERAATMREIYEKEQGMTEADRLVERDLKKAHAEYYRMPRNATGRTAGMTDAELRALQQSTATHPYQLLAHITGGSHAENLQKELQEGDLRWAVDQGELGVDFGIPVIQAMWDRMVNEPASPWYNALNDDEKSYTLLEASEIYNKNADPAGAQRHFENLKEQVVAQIKNALIQQLLEHTVRGKDPKTGKIVDGPSRLATGVPYLRPGVIDREAERIFYDLLGRTVVNKEGINAVRLPQDRNRSRAPAPSDTSSASAPSDTSGIHTKRIEEIVDGPVLPGRAGRRTAGSRGFH